MQPISTDDNNNLQSQYFMSLPRIQEDNEYDPIVKQFGMMESSLDKQTGT